MSRDLLVSMRPGLRPVHFEIANRYPGIALGFYQGGHRAQIIRAKVGKSLASLNYLHSLAYPVIRPYLHSDVQIYPAPTSLYSRLGGSFDVAATFADRIARQNSGSLGPARWRDSLRWRKRAFKSRERRWVELCPPIQLPLTPDVIVIDDVVTSGETIMNLLQTKARKNEDINVLVFTFALSPIKT